MGEFVQTPSQANIFPKKAYNEHIERIKKF